MLNKLKELRESREEGFTLIELLVVIVIIGVLAAIALPIFLNQQKAAIQAGVKSDVRNTVTAVATYLVKAPTADAAALAAVAVGNAAATGTGAANIKPVVSDSGTTITVAGKWDTYTVVGSNAGAGAATATPFTYSFDSATGKYTSAGN